MKIKSESTIGSRDQVNDSFDFQMHLDRLTLNFSGPDELLEQPFLESYSFRSLQYARFALVMGALLIGLFGILDGYLLPQHAHLLWFIRYAILCPTALLIALSTYRKSLVPLLPLFQVFMLVLTASGFTVMIMFSPAPVNSLYYSGLILVLIYGYTFLRLRFIWGTLAGWIIVGIYGLAAIRNSDIPLTIIINNLFFLVSANVIGMLASYSIEYYARNDFYLMNKMKEVQNKITDTNTRLESHVNERTLELQKYIEKLRVEIDERRSVEDALRESEGKYRELVENSPNAIAIYVDDKIVFVNNQCVHFMAAANKEDLIGKSVIQFVHPDYRAIVFDRMKQVAIDGKPLPTAEDKFLRLDGISVDAEVKAVPTTYEQKPAVQLIIQDITERKKAEKKLKEIITKNPMSIQILDKDGFTLEVNNSFKLLFGSPPPTDYSIFTDNQFAQQGLREIFDKLRTGEIVHFPDVCFNPHDSIPGLQDVSVWTRTIGFPLNDNNDKPEQFVLMHENITERKKVEEVVRKSEKDYQQLFENATDVIIIFEPDQEIIFEANAAACAIYGYTHDELVGMSLKSLTKNVPAGEAQIKDTVESGSFRNFETIQINKNGREIHFQINASLVEYQGRKAILSINRDITERKNVEQALRQAQKLESIGTLAGGIAHDFNNLMNAVLGQTSLALHKLPKESPAVDHITKAIKASERVADLTRQLLAYSGRGRFVIDEIDLNKLVEENVAMLEVSIPKTTQLRYELGTPSPHIMGDVSQLQQVIMNLIINAGESMGSNPGLITIYTNRIEIKQDNIEYSKYSATPIAAGSYALLQVKDNGSGISEKTLTRIFDPFFTTKFTGRGLGLAAVLGIIKGHKGGLRIESEVGKGTTFEIVFPLIIPSKTTEDLDWNESPIIDGKGKTILVIDDEASVIELLEDVLGEVNFKVIGALDPLKGIEIYRRDLQNISLVVLDYSMPNMNGKAAFEELLKINTGVKVLLCSGYSEEETMSVFGIDRPTGYFQKPYNTELLVRRVAEIVTKES